MKTSTKLSPRMIAASFFVWLLCCATPALGATRIVFHTLSSLVTARIDPTISPGHVSQHVHHVVGAQNFADEYFSTYLRQSSCTNLAVQADKSNYWQPLVYRVLSNGSYATMKTNTRIYYEQPATTKGVTVEPFPYSFRMLAGNPYRKTFTQGQQADLMTLFFCENFDSSGKSYGSESYTLPKQSCVNLVAKTFFPTCWSGRNFSLSDPFGHVAYPSYGGGYLGAGCPSGFPRRLPSVLVETYYLGANASPHSTGQQYILANGDTTGYGLHADFQNGWDTNVLKSMLRNCKTVPVEEPANQACPIALAASYSESRAAACAYNRVIPNEEVGYSGPLQKLPGCNKPWASGAKPTCTAAEYPGDPAWVKVKAGQTWP